MSAQLLAQKTIDVLRRDGWCQGTFVNEHGQHCLVGAMDHAFSFSDDVFSEDDYTLLRSRLYGHIRSTSLTRWNDRKCRTAKDVIKLLQKVAS